MLNLKHPNLGTVLAYCTLGPADEIARVEHAVHNRMRKERGWTGWRVAEVHIAEDADNMARLTVLCDPLPHLYAEPLVLEFLEGLDGGRRSRRLNAFLAACGISACCDETREIQGRFFSTRNGAATAVDFAPFERAFS